MWYFTSNFQKNLCPGKATRITMQSDLNSICSESLLRLSSQRKGDKTISLARAMRLARETGVHFPIPFRSVCSWARGSSAPPPRVHLTIGNWSGLGRYQTAPNSKFKFKFKKMKNFLKILKKFLKILQGATNLMVSNFLKKSFV